MSSSTRGHPRRQRLYEAERQAFEAPAPPSSQHGVVKHELPCCSLTHRDIIRDSGQKNNTSLFSPGNFITRPVAFFETNVTFQHEICIWSHMGINVELIIVLLPPSGRLYFLYVCWQDNTKDTTDSYQKYWSDVAWDTANVISSIEHTCSFIMKYSITFYEKHLAYF